MDEAQPTSQTNTDKGFEAVLSWLYAERKYQMEKFAYGVQQADIISHTEEEDRDIVEYWIQQFDSYIQRLPVFGLNTPQGVQAALKLTATALALCEFLANKSKLPKPGVPSGTIEEWS